MWSVETGGAQPWAWVHHQGVPNNLSTRFGQGMVVIGSAIWFFGGRDKVAFNDLFLLRTAASSITWEAVTPINISTVPNARNYHGMASISEKFFVFSSSNSAGGTHPSNPLHIFNTASLTWSKAIVTNPPQARYAPGMVAAVGSTLFLYGGNIGPSNCQNDMHQLEMRVLQDSWEWEALSQAGNYRQRCHDWDQRSSDLVPSACESGHDCRRDLCQHGPHVCSALHRLPQVLGLERERAAWVRGQHKPGGFGGEQHGSVADCEPGRLQQRRAAYRRRGRTHVRGAERGAGQVLGQ
mmetsp:Transcript_65431/g.161098  ORF Transcript_65431/g.161098 Transcript_65431/m.161098 type:complete len:295 (-) Transcript_65431:227-1111(-)